MGKMKVQAASHTTDTLCRVEVYTLKGGVVCLLRNVIAILLPVIGLGAVAMFLWGGFQILLSGGEPAKVQKAKATFTYAVLGVVLAILSWFVLVLIEEITGVGVTKLGE